MTPLSRNSQKRRDHKGNQTKHKKMTRKSRSHVRILMYRTWATCIPFLSCSLSIPVSWCILLCYLCSLILTFWAVIFVFHSIRWQVPTVWILIKFSDSSFKGLFLHDGGGPQLGEVTGVGGVTRLPIQSLILMWSRLHVRWGNPPHVTSPTWGTPPSCKQALRENTSETSRLIIMLLYFVHAAWRAGRGNRATQVKTRGSRVPLLASRFKSSNAEKFGIH